MNLGTYSSGGIMGIQLQIDGRSDVGSIPRPDTRKERFLMQPHDTTPTKICTKCGEPKPATTEYFDRHKKGRGGLSPKCKDCRRAYTFATRERNAERARAYYWANRERKLEYGREYHVANRDRDNRRNKDYYAANRETINRRLRTLYAQNPQYREDRLERSREWRLRNRDRLAAYDRSRAQTDERKSANRAWRVAHKERLAESGKQYYESNKDRLREKYRQYRQANKDRVRQWARAGFHRRRARILAAEGTHTAVDIQRQYEAQKGRCYYCHKKLGKTYHVDHVVPLSRGGTNGPENLVIACPKCNVSKNDRLPHEWPEGGRLL